jgi:glycosyltransferase involved in cell wall biosynthesis
MKKICYVVTISITIKAFFVKQLQYLSKNGFDVTVVCSRDDTLWDLFGNSVRYVPIEIPRGISVGGSVVAVRSLHSFFRDERFDLIQYSTPNAAFYASIASRWAGCKARNYHLMGFRYLGASGMGRFILKWIEKRACRNSTSIECVSESNLELGVQEGIFQREDATVVWHGSTGGVDLARFDIGKRTEYREEIRDQYGISSDEFVFGFVGRITRDKGVNEILEAFSRMGGAKLMMVGSPEGTDTLRPELYRSSLENPAIIYTGDVREVEKYYAAIDVLLLPSYREGFGNVVIEAGAIGTPAIVSDIPGPTDTIVKNETALVVAVKDVSQLRDAMERMRGSDCADMGLRAHEYVSAHFDSVVLDEHILKRKLELVK